MRKKFVQLEPKYILNEEWNTSGEISDLICSEPENLSIGEGESTTSENVENRRIGMILETDKEEILKTIRSIRIEVAEAAKTEKISSDEKYDYLKSEIGMNIVLPKGSITEMKFNIALKSEEKVIALDGFPKDVIDEKWIINGKVKVGINKAFEFIPIVGDFIGKVIDFELNPWEFKLGRIKRVNIDFSGGLTSTPEWYFKENGIKNDLRVALTIKKPKNIENIEGAIKAAWIYYPGFFKQLKLGTDVKIVKLY